MSSDRNLANTVSGRTARACDNCISKRAKWYCASDDAFLCQICDASVHSANPLARRHERVRLNTSSIKHSGEGSFPSWNHGFTRKPRTPRFNKNAKFKNERKVKNPNFLVPELCSDEISHEENEEQLLYRVPVFDPLVGEMCNSTNSNIDEQSKASLYDFNGALPSEMELEEFAADVETLLGKGLEDESFDMESLGLMDCSIGNGHVKIEDFGEFDAAPEFDSDIGLFDLNYDDNTPVQCDKDCEETDVKKKMKILLKLDYDSVITAWDEQKSPWTNNGERPELNSYDLSYSNMANSGTSGNQFGHALVVDKGREARVLRYREKRRRRLFSKKIRYEVRKLNAEKRPRIKGRFVKRANLATSDYPLLNI